MARWSVERKAGAILAAIAITEGAWLVVNVLANPRGFFRYTGWLSADVAPTGWIPALVVGAAFTFGACRLPSVRANPVTFSWLKVLGLAVAISAGFCEEAIFRKLLMDYLAGDGVGLVLQVLASGLAFGLVHWILGRVQRQRHRGDRCNRGDGRARARAGGGVHRQPSGTGALHRVPPVDQRARGAGVLTAVRDEMGSPR